MENKEWGKWKETEGEAGEEKVKRILSGGNGLHLVVRERGVGKEGEGFLREILETEKGFFFFFFFWGREGRFYSYFFFFFGVF